MDTVIQPAKPKLTRKNIIFIILLLIVYFSVTPFIFPEEYFPSLESEHHISLPREPYVIESSEKFRRAAQIEANWLILSPHPLLNLIGQHTDCKGSYLFCPSATLFSYAVLLLIIYACFIYFFINSTSKAKYLLLVIIIFGYGITGLITIDKYILKPINKHNEILTKLSNLSNTAPVPEGTQISASSFDGVYEENSIIRMKLWQNRLDTNLIFYPQPQQATTENLVYGDSSIMCRPERQTRKLTQLSRDLYLCEDVDGHDETQYIYYGFLDIERTVFVSTYRAINDGLPDKATALNEASSLIRFYNPDIK